MPSTHHKNSRSKVSRGIIIVDSSALMKLAAEVSSKYLLPSTAPTDEVLRYFETLSFLSRNGFQILIPEMVACLVANSLRDGKSLAQYFKTRERHLITRIINKFLKKSLDLGDISIVPPPPQDNTKAALYIRELWRIHTEPSSDAYKVGSITATRRIYHTGNMGVTAAHQLIQHMPPTHLRIFYLCDDGDALDKAVKIRPDLRVHKLTMINYVGALFANVLFPMFGVSASRSANLIDDIHSYQAIAGFESGFLSQTQHTNPQNQEAFSSALAGLCDKSEVKAKRSHKPNFTEEKPSTAHSGMERFMQRYVPSLRAPRPGQT